MPVLDSGARGSTTTFVERGIGDVLIAWENEALMSIKQLGPDKFELVVPSVSVLAEPPVTVVDRVAQRHGKTEVANAYLEYLYTPEGQEVVARDFYRPRNPVVAVKYKSQFPSLPLFTVDEQFGGWTKAQKNFLPMAGCSTRSSKEGNTRGTNRVLPGFGLALGFTLASRTAGCSSAIPDSRLPRPTAPPGMDGRCSTSGPIYSKSTVLARNMQLPGNGAKRQSRGTASARRIDRGMG